MAWTVPALAARPGEDHRRVEGERGGQKAHEATAPVTARGCGNVGDIVDYTAMYGGVGIVDVERRVLRWKVMFRRLPSHKESAAIVMGYFIMAIACGNVKGCRRGVSR